MSVVCVVCLGCGKVCSWLSIVEISIPWAFGLAQRNFCTSFAPTCESSTSQRQAVQGNPSQCGSCKSNGPRCSAVDPLDPTMPFKWKVGFTGFAMVFRQPSSPERERPCFCNQRRASRESTTSSKRSKVERRTELAVHASQSNHGVPTVLGFWTGPVAVRHPRDAEARALGFRVFRVYRVFRV